MQIASYWLNEHNNHNKQLNEQALNMINTTVKKELLPIWRSNISARKRYSNGVTHNQYESRDIFAIFRKYLHKTF